MIRLVVQIDLTDANVPAFEAYERIVLDLMPDHGGKLEQRLRGVGRPVETHVLSFPSQDAFDAYLNDPRRTRHAEAWRSCGARADRWEVTEIG